MMSGVSRTVKKIKRSSLKIQPHIIFSNDYSFLWDRNNFSIQALHFFFPVNRSRSLDQTCWVNHVAGSLRVNHQHRIRQLSNQSSCSSRVVQMNMGYHYIIHVFPGNPLIFQNLQKIPHGVTCTGFNKNRMTSFKD